MLPIACKVRMHTTHVCIFVKSTGGNRDACAYHVRARVSSIRVIVAPDVYFKSPSRRYKFHCYIFGRVMNGCSINSVVNEWWGCETEDAICDKGSLTLYSFRKTILSLIYGFIDYIARMEIERRMKDEGRVRQNNFHLGKKLIRIGFGNLCQKNLFDTPHRVFGKWIITFT